MHRREEHSQLISKHGAWRAQLSGAFFFISFFPRAANETTRQDVYDWILSLSSFFFLKEKLHALNRTALQMTLCCSLMPCRIPPHCVVNGDVLRVVIPRHNYTGAFVDISGTVKCQDYTEKGKSQLRKLESASE